MSIADIILIIAGGISYALLALVCITFIAGAERRNRDEDVNRARSDSDDVGGCA